MLHTTMSDTAIFRPVGRTRLTAQVTSHLRRRIVSGDLGFNRKLPPMGKLAKLYGVSQPTMRTAIHSLAALGLVRIEWGVGVYVRRPRTNAAVLDHAWRDATTTELASLMAVLNERLPMLAAAEVGRTADRRVIRDATELILLARERSALGRLWSADAFVDADLAFHRAVARLPADATGAPTLLEWLARRLRPTLVATARAHARDDRTGACTPGACGGHRRGGWTPRRTGREDGGAARGSHRRGRARIG